MQEWAAQLANGKLKMLAGIAFVNQNHWIAIVIEGTSRTIRVGDSLFSPTMSQQIPIYATSLVNALSRWLAHPPFAMQPIKTVPLPTVQQDDHFSCGLYAQNTLDSVFRPWTSGVKCLPTCYSPLALIPFPPPVNPEDAVPKIEATVSKLDLCTPGVVGGKGILKFFSQITQEVKAVEIKQQFEVLHESSASRAEAAKLRAATVVASRREYNWLRQANLHASWKRTLTDVPKNDGDKKCQIDTPDIMTSSQSLFQSAGPLNVAQVSHPKHGLMIKERETSKMKGPHQSGWRQTKEIKEAVRTYWWAPTFFLLLTEAAEKVCWVGPTKIVQQAQCTSPSLSKKLTSQVIGRHIVKGKGWNDDALRKAAQRESPGGKTTCSTLLYSRRIEKGLPELQWRMVGTLVKAFCEVNKPHIVLKAFEKAQSGEFSLANSSLTSPGMLDILRTLHIDNPPLFLEFSKPHSVPKVPLNCTQHTDGIQSDEPPFPSDDNEPSNVPFSTALAHAVTGEIHEGHLLQLGMKSIQPRPTLANELDNDFPEEDANDMGSNSLLGDGSSDDDYNDSLVSCSRDSIPSEPVRQGERMRKPVDLVA
ncbi:uncharacterized protein EI90DRAFT_3012901 [Cantharellus anzutake]|uniref:uncharacterized protein n=1 Tax=Cantharellus anzutake TaxID=1750568 RepID=UPI0019046068|nr:uncharacterized protein EI90DRAFT_3012901 [Cantharellus anzutake]KAF8340018.1 hypothetical protein EI90DRAFT_3012901 [Cantharellus anzutake]